ncbi:MAG: dephospho-CoA kinase [Lachnospiraceae bacterium]|nr:dephospho-CoA kinase [Lachnospiraceae bacterium]
MKVLGITGGVGAGKSTVLAYLEEHYGARVIQADEVGHLLQQPGESCYRRIVELFGPVVLNADGTISRPQLGAIVYADPQKMARLNAIMHPSIRRWIKAEVEAEQKRGRVPFVTIEAALLLEDHYDEICDEIWYIHADDAVRIRRLMESRGYSEEKCRSIMANQKKESDFRAACQLVIDNSSDIVQNTYEQMDKGLREHGFL